MLQCVTLEQWTHWTQLPPWTHFGTLDTIAKTRHTWNTEHTGHVMVMTAVLNILVVIVTQWWDIHVW